MKHAEADAVFPQFDGEPRTWSVSKLTKLSNLGLEELSAFRNYWLTIDEGQRKKIARQLADLADESAELSFDDIFRFLLSDPDPEVRIAAIEGLWECEDRSLIVPLIDLMTGDPSEDVRAAAAVGLGRFSMMAELGELRPKDTARLEDALFKVIDDKNQLVDVRRRAIEAISPITSERVAEVILEAYKSDIERVKVSAIFAMGKNCDDRWLPMLRQELASTDPEFRFEAVNACGELEDKRLVPDILPLLEDGDLQVQLATVDALGHIGGALAKRALKQCVTHPEELIREAAEEALEEISFADDPIAFNLD